MTLLTDQELHHLAMNTVGDEMESLGYEFLSINSKPKKDPQFVALKDKFLHFVVVRAVRYPLDPMDYDQDLLKMMKDHGDKYKARTYYGGVGIANARDYDMPVHHEDDFVVNFAGLIEIK
ncbi:MAG: Na(+)-translocating NADH-quinone reductase subunit F [Nonlabens sp.]